MAGPWEKYQKIEESKGPWSKYQEQPLELAPVPSATDSYLSGTAQGATLGFSDELRGTVNAPGGALAALIPYLTKSSKVLSPLSSGGSVIADLLPQGNAEEVAGKMGLLEQLKKYEQVRDTSRAANKAAYEANPDVYTGGNLMGNVVSAPFMPLKALSAIKGGSAITGGLMGALSGAGETTSPETAPKDIGINAGMGSVAGLIFGALSDKLSPSGLKASSEANALKAVGHQNPSIQKLRSLPEGKLNPPGVGRDSIDAQNLMNPNEFISKPVLNMNENATIAKGRVEELKNNTGEFIGQVLKRLDDAKTPEMEALRPTGAQLKAELSELRKNYLTHDARESKLSSGSLKTIDDALYEIGDTDGPLSFEALQKIKQAIGDVAFDATGKLVNKVAAQSRAIINNTMEQSADAMAQKLGEPGLFDKYMKAKDLHWTAKNTENPIAKLEAKEWGDRSHVVFDDLPIAAAGSLVHGMPGAVGAFAAKKLGQTILTRGNVAVGQKVASGMMSEVSKMLGEQPAQWLSAKGAYLSASTNPAVKSLGSYLTNMAERDEVGRAALLNTIMQNPTYREIMHGLASAGSMEKE